ncbi:melanoma-associated antigen B1-like [Orycteropus afer afer]|uniref:Melanoma-associated antigen B1-like n=1 Tax=Orycteropus afer afer TaxID=1230840 RepID=A0A8B7BAU8_ORYAF|nr:melanoma-associated antigen B1-like [Orycteropus afer afer]
MPRGQKSKLRAREKRQHARGESQGLQGAQATEEDHGMLPSSSPVLGDSPPSSPVSILQESERTPVTPTPASALLYKKSDGGVESQDEERPSPSQVPTLNTDPLSWKVFMLSHFLMEKYVMKGPIRKADMLKIVKKKDKKHFPEILRRTTERLEIGFGLELREVNPSSGTYALISQLDISSGGTLYGNMGIPRTGLLMNLLGLIFMKGNRITEEETWEFLNVLGIYPGRRHLIFGEPKKLLTKDLVQEGYLEYRQVPNSDPPRYEFLWGPRAHAETTKMKVLEILAKVNDSVPSAFPDLYEEALRDEAERAHARVVARARNRGMANASSKAMSSSSSHM